MKFEFQKEIDRIVEEWKKALPPRGGWSYILPSLNEGKRLLIKGWLMPYEASQIAYKIFTGEMKISDYDCVEEIDLNITMEDY